MTRKKKDIPLDVLRTLEPFINKMNKLINVVQPSESLFRIEDSDTDSSFYFEIVNHEVKSGNTSYQLDYKPKNALEVDNYKPKIASTYLGRHFDSWIKNLEGYDAVKTIYDDPILQDYEGKFYSQFEILDADAETNWTT